MPCELFPKAPVASFHALFDLSGVRPNPSADVRGTVYDADVITAVDHMSRAEAVVFGRRLFERVRRTGRAEWVSVLRVGVDFDTDEPHRLAAVVRAVKGRSDWPEL